MAAPLVEAGEEGDEKLLSLLLEVLAGECGGDASDDDEAEETEE